MPIKLFLERSRQGDTLIDLDRALRAETLCDMKKSSCLELFTGDLNKPIFPRVPTAYDAIFEKIICH